ncbi:hypothetical protein [Zobellia sp. 1_MG-2023]|uniref:hypothetical protein n=1 Tax=Zobellia sp. 1_MG-2023 TaxID=3062626 RepID=UPI0026E263AB|nr:hypothetical protein [Zobellia sp. 1_MG-2023]MDO6818922.1 hypothetical protein [Zobellia sp. 1_MG-2023]
MEIIHNFGINPQPRVYMILDYPNLIKLEHEIKILIEYRLVKYPFEKIIVETYYAMNGSIMCRVELFGLKTDIAERFAKYEAELIEGFYYEAEKILVRQMEIRISRNFEKAS